MRELLGIDKTLQAIQGQLISNTWKLPWEKIILLILKFKGSYIEIGFKTWKLNHSHDLKYYYKIEKPYRQKLQESNINIL